MAALAARLIDDKGKTALVLADEARAYSLGRLEQADLPVNDATVSRRHCSIAYERGWRVVDHESAQGTLVDGVRLAPGAPAELAEGSRVQLGCSEPPAVFTFADKPRPPKRPAPDDATAVPPAKRAPTAAAPAPRALAAPIGPERPASAAPVESEEPPPDLTGVSELMTGTAVRWDVAKGWGLVRVDGGGPNYFAHKQQLHSRAQPKSLREGEHVEFRLAYTDGRPKAVDITGPGGAFVVGLPAPDADGGARQPEPGAGQPGRGRGRGRSGLSFHAIELPGQGAPGAGRGGASRPRAALPFVPRQAARKAPPGAPVGAQRPVAGAAAPSEPPTAGQPSVGTSARER